MYKFTFTTTQLSNISEIKFCFLKGEKMLLLQSKAGAIQYLRLPNSVVCEKKDGTLILKTVDNNQPVLLEVVNNFKYLLKNLNKIFYKKLILKGLGFRMNLVTENETLWLKLKLGFSHLVSIEIPATKLEAFLKKSSIIFKSVDQVFLGNFLKKLKNLRLPNAYNGKGFWYKNEKISYKQFKKK